jgi:OmpA-OmpF porin, OOP family
VDEPRLWLGRDAVGFQITAKERKMRIRGIAVLLAASALSIPAHAADTGWYLFGDVGQTKVKDIDTTGIPNPSVDDTDTGFRVGGGYMFHKNFGAEIAYVDLGKATVTSGGQTVEAKASGEVVSLVGVLPIGEQFSLFARLGFINGTVKLSGPGGSVDSTDVKTTYGVGAGFNFTRQLGVRLNWDKFAKLGDSNTTGESDVDMISVGVVFKF